jgi:Skp family chaperone for outer membrane proteins
MKTSRICLLVTAALIAGGVVLTTSLAQTARPAAARLAVCDLVDVFNNYQRAKDLTAKLNDRRDAIKAESKKRQKAVDELKMELEGLKKGSRKYEQTFNEIARLSIEHKAYLQYQDALAIRDHHNLTKEMYNEIVDMIARVAQQGGYALVLQRQTGKLDAPNTNELLRQIYNRKVLYAADRMDITETVLLRLNQAYRATRPPAKKP